MPKPEAAAREKIDELLAAAGWVVCDAAAANITGHRGVAIREFQLKKGHGFADYMLYVDAKAAGVIEAKKQGATLVGVEMQSAKYTVGLPDALPSWRGPLPFAYESTSVETRFTSGLESAPRSRPVFAFHTPAMLAAWIADSKSAGGASAEASAHQRGAKSLRRGIGASAEAPRIVGKDSAESSKVAVAAPEYIRRAPTFLARMQHMPPLEERGLWPAQITAIRASSTAA